MIYTSTSIQDIIGRVIRNTRLQDSSLFQDMPEWIGEAMGMMKTKAVLERVWQDVPIQFHKGKLPCGLRSIIGVTYKGYRLRWYNGDLPAAAPNIIPGTDIEATVGLQAGDISAFGTSMAVRSTEEYNGEEFGYITETELTALSTLPLDSHTYYTELNHINTSFADGCARVFFRRMPVDPDGYPLIPDNENYKQAVYWYLRACIIGTGYKDPVFSYADCEARFERHANRARNEIRYPSTDQMETVMNNQVRLIMPDRYDSFFANTGKEGPISL